MRTGKFCDVGIIREDDQLAERDLPVTESQRRNSSVFSALRSNAKSSKAAKPDKTHWLVAQRECWFTPGAKAEGKCIIKWRYDENVDDDARELGGDVIPPTTSAFIRKFKVGDSIGLWAPVVRGNSVYEIDEVRMHAFWAV